jgi:hypothetical protein
MTHYTSYISANTFHSKETIKKQHIIKPQTRRVSAMDRDYVGQLRILAASASGEEPLVPNGYEASGPSQTWAKNELITHFNHPSVSYNTMNNLLNILHGLPSFMNTSSFMWTRNDRHKHIIVWPYMHNTQFYIQIQNLHTVINAASWILYAETHW